MFHHVLVLYINSCFDTFHSHYLHIEYIFSLFDVVLRYFKIFSNTTLIFDNFLGNSFESFPL